jgi:hypothetical protein
VSFANQTVDAGSVALQGGAGGALNGAFINSATGGQLFNVAGELKVAGGAGGSAGINNGSTAPLNTTAAQVIHAGSVVLEGGAAGSGNGAFINSNFGGNQTVTVPGRSALRGARAVSVTGPGSLPTRIRPSTATRTSS